MTPPRTISVGELRISNELPFVWGHNVLESKELALEVASAYKEVTAKLGIPFVFKASFDKANRSSIHSFRGPGLEKVKSSPKSKRPIRFVISGVHEPHQGQARCRGDRRSPTPAFLCRQTDFGGGFGRNRKCGRR